MRQGRLSGQRRLFGFFGPPEEALTFFDRYRSSEDRLLLPEIDFDDIYRILEDPKLGTPAQWAERYRQSDTFRQYVAARLSQYRPNAPVDRRKQA